MLVYHSELLTIALDCHGLNITFSHCGGDGRGTRSESCNGSGGTHYEYGLRILKSSEVKVDEVLEK